MFEEIKKILKEEYYIENIEPSANIKKDFGLTSFDFANIICLMEEKFNIEIDEEKYRSIETVDDFVKYIDAVCNTQQE